MLPTEAMLPRITHFRWPCVQLENNDPRGLQVSGWHPGLRVLGDCGALNHKWPLTEIFKLPSLAILSNPGVLAIKTPLVLPQENLETDFVMLCTKFTHVCHLLLTKVT